MAQGCRRRSGHLLAVGGRRLNRRHGQMHESRTAEAMLEGVEADAVIADKAYDSNAIRDTVKRPA